MKSPQIAKSRTISKNDRTPIYRRAQSRELAGSTPSEKFSLSPRKMLLTPSCIYFLGISEKRLQNLTKNLNFLIDFLKKFSKLSQITLLFAEPRKFLLIGNNHSQSWLSHNLFFWKFLKRFRHYSPKYEY